MKFRGSYILQGHNHAIFVLSLPNFEGINTHVKILQNSDRPCLRSNDVIF